MRTRRNPIERRVDRLRRQWERFSRAPDARLLRWVAARDERRMIEAFVETERHERAGQTRALFLRLDRPFGDPARYGDGVRRDVLAQYESFRQSDQPDGLNRSWRAPAAKGDGDRDLWSCCQSLHQHYRHEMDQLVLALEPSQVASPQAWRRWLEQASGSAPASGVRMLLVDSKEQPRLASWNDNAPAGVVSLAADLDMPAAQLELLAETGDPDAPDSKLRAAYVRIGQAAVRGDHRASERIAREALALAHKQSWPAQAATLQLARGAQELSAKRFSQAQVHFRAAELSAGEAEKRGGPAGAKLALYARLAQGATHQAAGDRKQRRLCIGMQRRWRTRHRTGNWSSCIGPAPGTPPRWPPRAR